MMISPEHFNEKLSKDEFAGKIIAYYEEHGREFSRRNTGNTYPIVDGNVVRVFKRHFNIEDDSLPSQNDEIWELSWELLPKGSIKEYNLG